VCLGKGGGVLICCPLPDHCKHWPTPPSCLKRRGGKRRLQVRLRATMPRRKASPQTLATSASTRRDRELATGCYVVADQTHDWRASNYGGIGASAKEGVPCLGMPTCRQQTDRDGEKGWRSSYKTAQQPGQPSSRWRCVGTHAPIRDTQ